MWLFVIFVWKVAKHQIFSIGLFKKINLKLVWGLDELTKNYSFKRFWAISVKSLGEPVGPQSYRLGKFTCG
jgi:hypothetical protein